MDHIVTDIVRELCTDRPDSSFCRIRSATELTDISDHSISLDHHRHYRPFRHICDDFSVERFLD